MMRLDWGLNVRCLSGFMTFQKNIMHKQENIV